MLSTRDPPQNKRFTQNESDRIEKYITCKWRLKKARVVILVLGNKMFQENYKTMKQEIEEHNR